MSIFIFYIKSNTLLQKITNLFYLNYKYNINNNNDYNIIFIINNISC